MSESLSIKWNRRFRGLTMFVFSISALDRSSKALSWVGSSFSISSAIPFSKHHFFQSGDQKAVLFTVFSLFKLFFSRGWQKKTYLKRRLLFRSQIFKFCYDIQGSHLIGYLWIPLIIDQSECLISFFLCTELTLFCTELTLFCTELPENCIYLNQSELRNFSM